ncbi:MAG: IreB family regulatory phosphoprotein [Bacilli bacterium]|jgi:uncharacterized protein (UPF0297 family)
MDTNTTNLFQVEEFNSAVIFETLKEVYEALEERGYNPINQLVGYLLSGDPGYIPSHREARTKISKLDRTKVLELIVKEFIKELE